MTLLEAVVANYSNNSHPALISLYYTGVSSKNFFILSRCLPQLSSASVDIANFLHGIWIQPSHHRLSQQGVRGSVPGRPLINASCGPMTRKISETVKFLSIIWSDDWISSRDPYVPSVKWNQKEFDTRRPLRIGTIFNNVFFRQNWVWCSDLAETGWMILIGHINESYVSLVA